MSSVDGTPRIFGFVGDHEDILSVIAPLRNRLGAVLPEKEKCNGSASREASEPSEMKRGAMVSIINNVGCNFE